MILKKKSEKGMRSRQAGRQTDRSFDIDMTTQEWKQCLDRNRVPPHASMRACVSFWGQEGRGKGVSRLLYLSSFVGRPCFLKLGSSVWGNGPLGPSKGPS